MLLLSARVGFFEFPSGEDDDENDNEGRDYDDNDSYGKKPEGYNDGYSDADADDVPEWQTLQQQQQYQDAPEHYAVTE